MEMHVGRHLDLGEPRLAVRRARFDLELALPHDDVHPALCGVVYQLVDQICRVLERRRRVYFEEPDLQVLVYEKIKTEELKRALKRADIFFDCLYGSHGYRAHLL